MGVNSIFLGNIGITLLFTTSLALAQANQCTEDLSACYEAAEEGVAEAQFYLGLKYAQEKSYIKAVQWYRKAAEQGVTTAQHNLALLYLEGKGVAQSNEQAVYWYRKAAEQGHAHGQANLGFMYREGKGVAQSNEQAVYWYRKAAEQGNVYAQSKLGAHYRGGLGVAKSDNDAVYWLYKAAQQGNREAKDALGFMFQNNRMGNASQQVRNDAAKYNKEWAKRLKTAVDGGLASMKQNAKNPSHTQTNRVSCRAARYDEQKALDAIWQLASVCGEQDEGVDIISYGFFCKDTRYELAAHVTYSKRQQRYYTEGSVGGFFNNFNFNEAVIATCAYYARQYPK